MAEKEISNVIKLQIEAGKATPAPPVGPALGSSGVNIMQFVKEFNDRTANQPGMIIPVVITVYKDKSFDFITKVPPVAVLIKKAIKIQKGSGKPNREKVGTITKAQIEEIRGVSADHAVNKLIEKNLICETGRLNAVGKPILFGTTNEFLKYFGFKSTKELPPLKEEQIEEETENIDV